MITIRKSHERGHANHGWLDSYHSFSFAQYNDPAHEQYSVLRVINEDIAAAGTGFGMHPHRDMEIITYILSGELRHQDSMGNGSVIGVGDVQRMTAGSGIRHSEVNASLEVPVHLLQIWVHPAQKNLAPEYEEKHFSAAQKENRWCLIVSPNGEDGSVTMHQDASIFATLLTEAKTLNYTLSHNRCAYLQLAKGNIQLNRETLMAGDAAMIEDMTELRVIAEENAEILLFDLPKI